MIFPAANAVSICLFISATKAVIRADFLSPAMVASVSPALRRETTVSSEIPRVEVMTESSAVRGAILSIGFGIGLGIPFILSGLYLDRSKRVRTFFLRRGSLISKIGGVALIIIGLMQVTGVWADFMISLRSLISEFAPVI